MTLTEIIPIIILASCSGVGWVIIRKLDALIKLQYEENRELLKFCLQRILSISIENEDYMTAEKCRKLLENFKNQI